eukprot:9351654-Karenia_brevis.AAC.1
MKDQADALECTIPQKHRLEWMATWFVWGIQRVCSDKAIRGLNDILVQANTIKENVIEMGNAKKALEEQIAIEAF